MIRIISPFLCILIAPYLSEVSWVSLDAQDRKVSDLTFQVDPSNLSRHILALQNNIDLRSKVAYRTRSAHRIDASHNAAEYIASQLAMNPLLKVEIVKSGGVENVIATLEGSDSRSENERSYIISAHYDSSASNEMDWNPLVSAAPGADDNASGVAAMLEAARILSCSLHLSSIKFVAFEGSETGYLGSQIFASESSQRKGRISAVINLDTIGGNFIRDQVDVVSNAHSEWLGRSVSVINSWDKIGLKVNQKTVPSKFPGDQKPFWDLEYNAITLTENLFPSRDDNGYEANRYYRTYQDTFDKLNLNLIRKVCQLTVSVAFRLANLNEETSGSSQFSLHIDSMPATTYQDSAIISGGYISDFPIKITFQPGDIEVDFSRDERRFSFPVNLKAGKNLFRVNLLSIYDSDSKVLELTYIPPFQFRSAVFPNPASDLATFHCEATRTILSMEVFIYSVSGEFVRWLSGTADKNYDYVQRTWWNLKNSNGNIVADGVYVCQVKVFDGESEQRRTLKLAVERR